MSRRRQARVTYAILGGAAASAGITTTLLMAFNVTSGSARFMDFMVAHAAWFALSFVVTGLVAATLGLGWYTFCQRRGWSSVHAYWVAGAVAGFIPGALWLLPSGAGLIAAFVLLYGAALGVLTGLFAWLIRRPDRDHVPEPAPNSTSV